MRRTLLLAILLASAHAGPSSGLSLQGHSSQRVIVGVVPGAQEAVEQALRTAGARVVRHQPGALIVAELTGRLMPGAVAGLTGVRFVEPDAEASIDANAPNDPSWLNQWAHMKIALPQAWDVAKGSSRVVVGVLDTGVDLDHPDLRDRLWLNPAETPNGRDDDGNGFVDDIHGADCRDGGDPRDEHDHGTHVAGIIGSSTNNGIGVAGLDWRVRIMALRWLGPDGRGRLSDAIRCLDYAVAMGAQITNHSWGTEARSRALEEAFDRARDAGMLAVTSAGNDGLDLDAGHPHYPSSFDHDNVLAVAATTTDDRLAAWSNHGSRLVHIAAPGAGILSTVRGGYGTKSGTSMAAPHVTGAAALILSAHPGIGYRAVIERLLGSVDRTKELETRVGSGGRLQVARALQPDAGPPARPKLHSPTALRTPSSVTIAWLAPDAEGRAAGTTPVSRYQGSFANEGTDPGAPPRRRGRSIRVRHNRFVSRGSPQDVPTRSS